MSRLDEIVDNEELRRELFPVARHHAFLAHAGVCPLPKVAADALRKYADEGSEDMQESPEVWERVARARAAAARLIGARAEEISLLGPTSLGLSLVALGLEWKAGDEVVYHADDYPANVYAWMDLRRQGVKAVALRPAAHGRVTWEDVEALLTPRTRLVALSSAHYLSGHRLDVDGIGERLGKRCILFCLDAIQTMGAFPMDVRHVDFLSADSHKWLLGPMGAGILYVKESRAPLMRPRLLGSWNVQSPEFLAQEEIVFEPGGRRYEPGALNFPGIYAMGASMEMLLGFGMGKVAERILTLRQLLVREMAGLGWNECFPIAEEAGRAGMVSFAVPEKTRGRLAGLLEAARVRVSLRRARSMGQLLRVSAHAYNTGAEVGRLLEVVEEAVRASD